MTFLGIVSIILLLTQLINCQNCPAMYSRLSTDHSYCKDRNPDCNIFSAGISNPNEIDEILKAHNTYRNKIAMGHESRAGDMPQAANMMEMVYDHKLAAVAQKWAEQCKYQHDCRECRAMMSYSVGQNLAYMEWSCPTGNCKDQAKDKTSNWTAVIKMFYDEITNFDNKLIGSVHFQSGKVYGHFTQVIWATSWRVGCGYVTYEINNKYRQLYACNYGPAGNVISQPVYEIGSPCTLCPINSCCGETCDERLRTYPGLCHMLDKESAPMYPVDRSKMLFFCDFQGEKDCEYYTTGKNAWETIKTLSGTVLSAVLKSGEKCTVHFSKKFTSEDNFCMILRYRKGPNQAGKTDASNLSVFFDTKSSSATSTFSMSSNDFIEYSLDMYMTGTINKFSFTFAVPHGASPQYLNIQSIQIQSGKCKEIP